MSDSNLIEFLRLLAVRPDVLERLVVKGKDEVITAASDLGLPFTEAEFDSLIWALELRLADKRGEKFDQHFGLWSTMWGQYYLEYLVTDLIPSLDEAGVLPVAPSDPLTSQP